MSKRKKATATEKKWALVQTSEDGETVKFLNREELTELLEDPEAYSDIENFLKEIPEKGPMLWPYQDALLLEISVVVPRAAARKFKLPEAS